jgi:integrase
LTARFVEFCEARNEIPNENTIHAYVASMRQKGLAHATILKNMAFARHVCKALARQIIDPNLSIDVKFFYQELRHGCSVAAAIPNPKSARKIENAGSVYANGKRLTPAEAQTILDHIDKSTLAGRRDYALLLTGFLTGLRLSEIARITRASLQEYAPGQFSVTVRAKGNKYQPRAIPTIAVRAIDSYINAFNAQLGTHDPRRIGANTPIWQSLTRSDNIPSRPTALSTRAISEIIHKRTAAPDATGLAYHIAPHDLRRTWAAWADQFGMEKEAIQGQCLHASYSQTEKYIARPRDVTAQDITAYGLALQ